MTARATKLRNWKKIIKLISSSLLIMLTFTALIYSVVISHAPNDKKMLSDDVYFATNFIMVSGLTYGGAISLSIISEMTLGLLSKKINIFDKVVIISTEILLILYLALWAINDFPSPSFEGFYLIILVMIPSLTTGFAVIYAITRAYIYQRLSKE